MPVTRKFAALLTLIVLSPTGAFAQAVIAGTAKDASGAVQLYFGPNLRTLRAIG